MGSAGSTAYHGVGILVIGLGSPLNTCIYEELKTHKALRQIDGGFGYLSMKVTLLSEISFCSYFTSPGVLFRLCSMAQ